MKTVVIWDERDYGIHFAVLDGDFTHLDGIYINGYHDPDKTDELDSLMFDEDGKHKQELLDKFPEQEVRDGAHVIVAGFLP